MSTAIELFHAGFTQLVSVIPPNASLSPSSRIQPSQLGKTPGTRWSNGVWAGYKWSTHEASVDDARQWDKDGANIGMLAANFPGVDIDTLNAGLAETITRIAFTVFGPAPVRTGRAPKRLLVYGTKEPFARMAINITVRGESHLVEVLGLGRQYLVEGMHPSGSRYTWDIPLYEYGISNLVDITRDLVALFFDAVELAVLPLGATVQRLGDGQVRDRSHTLQADLLAPSMDALRECVALIPNTDELFPTREDYIKVGYAVRAAAGEEYDEGFEVFAEWCVRHEADGRVGGNPETWRSDWGRMHGPYSVGWEWLTEQARPHGFNTAKHEFTLVKLDTEREEAASPPRESDAWLADLVVAERGDKIRFVATGKKWYVWDGSRWAPDATLLAEHLVGEVLREYAGLVNRRGATQKEKDANARLAVRLCSAGTHRNVLYILRNDPRIAISEESFDHNRWIVNTPGGIIDLRTGKLGPSDPEELCSRTTKCAPDKSMVSPVWNKFLDEVTRGDFEFQKYLQRLAGYALSGSIEEQMLAFFWGTGQNGKGNFVYALMGVMESYAQVSTMDTFTAAKFEQHPTNIAGLAGARLVSATETDRGSRWDEQKIKSLTGGDPIRTRLMRENFFTFIPQFTLLFLGNQRPAIRDLDDALRRRFHLIPFTFTPTERDTSLPGKFMQEAPAILQWMIDGCLAWQAEGLNPPQVVLDATAAYFEDEDPIGRWLHQECLTGEEHITAALDLFHSWQEWANERGEHVGSVKRFSQTLFTKHFQRVHLADSRRAAFRGIALREVVLKDLI